jgi:HlyD family secretion protein
MSEASAQKLDVRWLWVPAILLLVLVFFGVHRLTRQELPVRVARVERESLTKPSSTNGKVEPAPGYNFEATAPAPGTVKRLYVHAGEKVKQGQLLLSMDDADALSRLATALTGVRSAQANLLAVKQGGTQEETLNLGDNITKAQADVSAAQKNLATLEKLQSQGAASPSEVQNASQTLASAQLSLSSFEKRKTDRFAAGDLAHAQAALADAQAAYSAAEAVIAESNVRAPFNGTVYSLPVSQTEYVQQGSELLQMADLSKLEVRAYFDEPEIGTLKVGQPSVITWDAKPSLTWTGHVMRLPSTIVNFGNRNVGETLVSIDSSNEAPPPNANVTVKVTTEHVENALTVPRDALHREAGKDYVYLVNGRSIRRRNVTTGAINLTQVQILSGLGEGDVVALGTTNGEPLAEGVPIREIE